MLELHGCRLRLLRQLLMDQRQVGFVAAAIRDELRQDDIILPEDRLQRVAEIATKAAVGWMIGAAQEGLIEAVHVDSERPT